jgi:transglutaminase-like putative cysteine protease
MSERHGHRAVQEHGTPALAPDIVLLAVSLAAGLGTARLTLAPGAAHVVGPIVASVVAGHLGAAVARRLGASAPTAVAAGVATLVLTVVWGQLPGATSHGLPTPSTWRALVSRFDAAGTVIRSHPTPVPATADVVLCIATGAGLVAVAARTLWAWGEERGTAALVALVPSFGLFCYTALLSSQVDRVAGELSYLVGALAFVIVADRAMRSPAVLRSAGSGSPSAGSDPASAGSDPASAARRFGSGLRTALPALAGATLAVAVPLATTPALATLKVNALPFSTPGGAPQAPGLALATGNSGDGGGGIDGAGGGGPGINGLRAIDLVDNLRAVLVNENSEVMFVAQSTLPTYWQVALLADFDGTAWLPDPTTQAAAQSFALSPPDKEVPYLPALPEPAPTATFRSEVTIGALASTLLPLPPTTVSVTDTADLVPGFGAVQSVESAPGQHYDAVARVPVNPTGRAPRSTTTVAPTALAPYLQLPTEPDAVVRLAHQIVAGVKGPAAEAAALARWFDSGRYRYTLSPPAATGSDPLESFLFTTRAGFCQQFAAAYGVLARIDGLPTRVAVGFTTGSFQGHDRYRVTGADAHVWPEVYLGPSTGWTSYEPTPASSGEANGVGVNSGTRSGPQNPGARSTATTASTLANQRHPSSAKPAVPSTLPVVPRATATPLTTHRSSSPVALVLGLVGAVVVVAGLALGLWMRRRGRSGGDLRSAWRRIRRRRGRALEPTAEVLAQWRDADVVLGRGRLGRRSDETLQEHAARLRSLAGAQWLGPYRPVEGNAAIDTTVDAYARLAALAARASYASDPCTPDDAAEAERLGSVVRRGVTGARMTT